jgi:hypothetical protein
MCSRGWIGIEISVIRSFISVKDKREYLNTRGDQPWHRTFPHKTSLLYPNALFARHVLPSPTVELMLRSYVLPHLRMHPASLSTRFGRWRSVREEIDISEISRQTPDARVFSLRRYGHTFEAKTRNKNADQEVNNNSKHTECASTPSHPATIWVLDWCSNKLANGKIFLRNISPSCKRPHCTSPMYSQHSWSKV